MARCVLTSSATGAITFSRLMVSSVARAFFGSSWSWSCAFASTAAVSSFLNSASSFSIAALRASGVSTDSRTISATARVRRA